MVNLSPARVLFKACRFKEAVEAYKRQLQEGPEDEWANTDGLGSSLMAAGEFAEAIPYLEKVSEYRQRSLPGSPGCDEQVAVCYWMIGARARALDIVKALVIGVRDRKITYTDFSGGTSQGVILCYMAATLGLRSDVDLAMTYLKKLATRSRIKSWPGPAALFLLGQMTFEDAVKDATGSADTVQAREIVEKDVLKRRHLTNILFATAVERRMVGDEAGCRTYMTECASLTTPFVEYEWHLARGEVSAQ